MRDDHLPSLNPIPQEEAALSSAASDVALFAGTPANRAMDNLLEHLEQEYLAQLRTVGRDELAHLQGTLAQVTALREVVRGGAGDARA